MLGNSPADVVRRFPLDTRGLSGPLDDFQRGGIMRADPWLASVRDTQAFSDVLAVAGERHGEAARAFEEAGGLELLPGLRLQGINL